MLHRSAKMSTQRGNFSRQRPQKYKNSFAFKNDMHDKTNQTKMINSLQVRDVCNRCKEVIEWKIKYKKYKPLTQPKTCVQCNQKTVRHAYHVMCIECGKKTGKCTKCCKSEEVIEVTVTEKPFKINEEMKYLLKGLDQRRRNTFNRYMEKKKGENMGNEELTNDLIEKLKHLKLMKDRRKELNGDKDDDFDSGDENDENSVDELSGEEDE